MSHVLIPKSQKTVEIKSKQNGFEVGGLGQSFQHYAQSRRKIERKSVKLAGENDNNLPFCSSVHLGTKKKPFPDI